MNQNHNIPSLEERLAPVMELLHKQLIEGAVTQRQQQANADVIEQLMARQHQAALQRELKKLDCADIAHLLNILPSDNRPLIWNELNYSQAGEVLVELPESVAEFLVEQTDPERLNEILKTLDTDELTDIADFLPSHALEKAKATLATRERDWLENSLEYPEDSVGDIMSMDSLVMPETLSIDEGVKLVRSTQDLPPQTDKLFVVNNSGRLTGVIPLINLIRENGESKIKDCMSTNVVTFSPYDDAEDAGLAFERYDLISAPVLNEKRHVIGRLTVESIMDHLRMRADSQALTKAGLSADTDLFGPIFQGAKQRWPWLCINLMTAFIATRFISIFENTIEQLVALATLMPIVASVGGNTGNQTAALLIRGLAMSHINRENLSFIYRKEVLISAINGLIWGSILGLCAWLLYSNIALGLIMATAITLNLVLASIIGITVPLALNRMKRDPAMGSSVVLTFVTDSMGFFIFLGLASIVF